MRILLLCLFSIFPLLGNSQMLIKGSVFYPVIQIFDRFYESFTLGTEIKYKRIGIEYIYNNFKSHYGTEFKYDKQQLSLKYYFVNKQDSLNPFKIYISPFLQYKNLYYMEDIDTEEYGLKQSAKGIGYGLLIGGTRDFYKYFGVEPGFFAYYLLTKEHKFEKNAYKEFYSLRSGLRFGFRIFIYLKLPDIKAQTECKLTE